MAHVPDPLYDGLVVEVMGIPVSFRSSSVALLEAAARRFGGGDAVRGASGHVSSAAVEVILAMAPVDEASGPQGAAPLTFTLAGRDVLRIAGPGARGEADAVGGRGRLAVAPSVAADKERFEHGILEAVTLFLVTERDRQPVHAAGVLLPGGAVLLAAPGGTGKSTLTYALLRVGTPVLSDDAVYLQSRPTPAVWGLRKRLCLPLDAAETFPELADRRPVRRADGRMKLVVDLGAVRSAAPTCAEPLGVCLLERGGGPPGVTEISPETAVSALMRGLEPGFDRFAHTLPDALREVAERGAWRLDLPPEPAAAAALVRSLVRGAA
jgi:hypothetical protein